MATALKLRRSFILILNVHGKQMVGNPRFSVASLSHLSGLARPVPLPRRIVQQYFVQSFYWSESVPS
jgi:hypothetical protein